MKSRICAAKSLRDTGTVIGGSDIEKALGAKYGPSAAVTSKSGKLQIGGLLQVWYYSIRNDRKGLFNDPAINGIPDTNERRTTTVLGFDAPN